MKICTSAMHCYATGVISSVSGTAYDLRSSTQIGTVVNKLADTNGSGINVTYCLPGPTGSRLAARSALVFSTVTCGLYMSIVCTFCLLCCCIFVLPSVLWRCWLVGRKGTRPVKTWVVGCWRGYVSGVRCRLAYGPADAIATHCLLLY